MRPPEKPEERCSTSFVRATTAGPVVCNRVVLVCGPEWPLVCGPEWPLVCGPEWALVCGPEWALVCGPERPLWTRVAPGVWTRVAPVDLSCPWCVDLSGPWCVDLSGPWCVDLSGPWCVDPSGPCGPEWPLDGEIPDLHLWVFITPSPPAVNLKHLKLGEPPEGERRRRGGERKRRGGIRFMPVGRPDAVIGRDPFADIRHLSTARLCVREEGGKEG
ncbi:hypothetical protein EYF80_036116 [Liparis tanakae]|uniref:Uncharacterized protein n=1 Tax=Liparis tanakae TaxID=230148 RepID=A0A4Z2GKD9_9TELE|nr:hypothetical protein EYF80_036116 [Liparis tanakae]